MNRRLALALGAFTLLSTLATQAADARPGRGGGVRVSGGGRAGGGIRVTGGGGVRFGGGRSSGGVTVQTSPRGGGSWRPRGWSVGGRVVVGGGVYVGRPWYPRYYRPYYGATYVPSYYDGAYDGGGYYPVAPAQGPGVVAVAPAYAPELPRLALGVFAGGVSVEGIDESSDLGLLGRFRLGNGGLMVEGEIGKQSYANDLRIDRRLGASLIWEIGAENRFAPYVLGGLGVQQADVAGTYESTQNFGELGVGIRYAITPRFHLAADVRAGSRATISSDTPMTDAAARLIAPPSSESGETESYARSRISALIYF